MDKITLKTNNEDSELKTNNEDSNLKANTEDSALKASTEDSDLKTSNEDSDLKTNTEGSDENVISYIVVCDEGVDYFLIITIDDDKPKNYGSLYYVCEDFLKALRSKDYHLHMEFFYMGCKMSSQKDKAKSYGINTPIIITISTFVRLIGESSSSSFTEFMKTVAKVYYEPLLHRIPSTDRDKTVENLKLDPGEAGKLISQLKVRNLRVTSRQYNALKRYWSVESKRDYLYALWGSWDYQQRRQFIVKVRHQMPISKTEPYFINESGEREDVSGVLLFCPDLNVKDQVRGFPSYLDKCLSSEFDDHIYFSLEYYKKIKHRTRSPSNTDIDREYISIRESSYGNMYRVSSMPSRDRQMIQQFVEMGYVATSDQYWFIDERLRFIFEFLAAAIDDIRRDYKGQKYIHMTKVSFNSYCGCCKKEINNEDDEVNSSNGECKCKNCKIIAYCNSQCRDSDAKKHKKICNIFRAGTKF